MCRQSQTPEEYCSENRSEELGRCKSTKGSEGPEITRVRVEKEKVEKKILRKPRFPFGQTKEETVVEYKKREIKESVPVDPAVLNTGWVKAEQRIAVIIPPKPAKPGRSVFGKPIMSDPPEESPMLLGEGVKKGRGELAAAYSGFVRIGNNWVDVIPFEKHSWKLRLSEDRVTVLLDFTPGSRTASVPDIQSIMEEAVSLGAAKDTMLSVNDVSGLVAGFIREQKPVTGYPISGDQDAECSIDITDNKLLAVLNVKKGRGKGKPLVLKEVGSMIQRSGLKGLDFSKIREDLVAFYKSSDTSLKDYTLVQGTEPGVPEKRKLTIAVPFIAEKEVQEIKARAKDLPEGALKDYPSVDEFPVSIVEGMALVKAGMVLASLSAYVKAEPGRDVLAIS